MQRKEQHWPGLFDLSRLGAIRTVREFDNTFTAPHFGFADAEDYYYRCSAMRVADRIGVPALIITAEDDPFVPPDPFRSPVLAANRHIELHLTRYGGHCGFVGARTAESDGYWAEDRIVDFAARHHARRAEAASRPAESGAELALQD
jgi:predicted alpha/beta-fold hydrolase